jgi:hypothetical protein
MKLYSAYMIAYRSGEIAAFMGDELDSGLGPLLNVIYKIAGDKAEAESNERALHDAYDAGRFGDEPLTRGQVEMHYD